MNRSSFSDTATCHPVRPLLAAVLAAFALAACSNTSNVASGANAEGLLKASAAAAQAVTLSDADVMQLADKSCAEMDGKAKVASAKGKSAQRLARLVKGMPKEVTGLIVAEPGSKAKDYPLKKWDVITRVGDHVVDNQGYVEVRDGLRLKYMYYVPQLAKDGRVPLTILRDGKELAVEAPVAPDRELVIPALKDAYPEYFIYGPLVFTAATQEYIRNLGGSGVGLLAALDSPMLARLTDAPAEPGEQIVVLATRMFPHPITKGYDSRPLGVIDNLSGTKVKNLAHLAELLRESKEEFLRFEMADRSESLVFRRSEIEAATESILVDEGIRYQASESLRGLVGAGE
jgi:hypothetical protein